MTKLSTTDSYLVRIYRVDSEDPHRLTGQVELLDGSGTRTPFTDCVELTTLLSRGAGKKRRRGKTLTERADEV